MTLSGNLALDSALEELHTTATRLFTESLASCSIESAFDRRIRFEDQKLHRLIPDGSGPDIIDLSDYKRIFVIAMGKAAGPMLTVLLDRMKRRQGLRGICCGSPLPAHRNWRIRYFEGGHPLPNEDSFAAARATLALLKKAKKDTLIFFLISGGSSAMIDLPLDPEISLADTIAFHETLLASGAPIQEINTLRKHFSAVKGGRLAIAAPEARKISLLLPDVPLRSLDALASGPTTPDHTTVDDVRAILDRYNIAPRLPRSVREFFEREDLPESPGNKPEKYSLLPRLAVPGFPGMILRRLTSTAALKDEDDAFRNSIYEILLSTHDLVENARAIATQAGFHVAVDNSCDDWDYAEAAQYLLARFHELRADHPRLCLISAGEVTVTIDRTPGAGGRNQQFALACALELEKYPDALLTVLSAGTDGIDGNTRSAGAIADPTTVARARAFGYDPTRALAEFDACPLFTALGDSVVTGPTGHNLRDLRLFLADSTATPRNSSS
jgi:hydroxypyruvate reductase